MIRLDRIVSGLSRVGLWVVALLASTLTPSWAHPLSLTRLELAVFDDLITGRLEVLLEDLYLFHGLVPNEDDQLSRADLRVAALRHEAMISRDLVVSDGGGRRFQLRVESGEPPESMGSAVSMTDLMNYSVYYDLSSRVDRPFHFLTVVQSFGGESGPLPAVMELRVKTDDGPFSSPVSLSKGVPHNVDLKAPPNAVSEDRLGIEGFGSVYSFVYVGASEVRHELLIPLSVLRQWVSLTQQDESVLEVSERDRIASAIGEFVCRRNPLRVDGRAVQVAVDRVDFFGLDQRDLAEDSAPRRLSALQARIGVVLRVRLDRPPRSVDMTWDLFGPTIPKVRSTLFVGKDPGESYLLTSGRPSLSWKGLVPKESVRPVAASSGPGRRALLRPTWIFVVGAIIGLWGIGGRRGKPSLRICVSMGLGTVMFVVGALLAFANPDPDDAVCFPDRFVERRRIVEDLLRNVYLAMEAGPESETYDLLAASVGGEFLSTMYVELRKVLVARERDGSACSIDGVDVEDLVFEGPRDSATDQAFSMVCDWLVTGSVEHWGHVHSRRQEVRARLALEGRGGGWKLDGMEILDVCHRATVTSLRSARRARFIGGVSRRFDKIFPR